MKTKMSGSMKAVILSLICVVALSVPVSAGQGKGKGNGRGRVGVDITRDSTPGVPTSARGRGRNYYPRTRRGRYTRSTTLITTRKRSFDVPRRVRRGRNLMPRTRRGSIY